MALWGNNDNVGSTGTVSLNYSTGVVTGSGTSFGIDGGCSEGDIIRFGVRGGGNVFYGDAVIVSIANSESLTIGSTAGLSGAAIAGKQFYISQLPKSSIVDQTYSRTRTDADALIYGVNTEGNVINPSYYVTSEGWVGVTTYMDNSGALRVKKETLVAMSGIQTGDNGIAYPTAE